MDFRCTITDIAWERVILKLTAKIDTIETGEFYQTSSTYTDLYEIDEDPVSMLEEGPEEDEYQFKLRTAENMIFYPLKTTKIEKDKYVLEVNITNAKNREPLENGVWVVSLRRGNEKRYATVDLNLVEEFNSYSRVYLLNGNSVGYTISFGINEDENAPLFLVRAYYMYRKKTLQEFQIVRFIKRKRKALIVSIMRLIFTVLNKLIKKHGNRVLFASESRTAIQGNLLCVRDRMVKRGLDKEYKLDYSFRNATGGNQSTLSWFKLVLKLSKSDIILVDDYFPVLEYLEFSPGTKIIQVWHAGSGFKSIGYSRFGNIGSPGLKNNAHRKYTYAITGSEHLVPFYAEAFGIEESAIIPTGLPRIDLFLDDKRIEYFKQKFYDKYPQFKDKKIILFAPTFRGRNKKTAYYNYEKIDFAKLYEFCKDEYVVLFKIHPFVAEPVPIDEAYQDRFVDVTSYKDINDLLHITDILITDYSSTIYEFSLLKRPMLFYAYDKKAYSLTRGFHRDYDKSAPGKICETFEELITALENKDYEFEKVEQFLEENFDNVDTQSTDRVIDWLILGNMPESLMDSEPAQ